MAITARFAADFSSFYDAVNKAEVELKSFEQGAGKVEKSLNRMVDSFSGRRLIQEATLAATAVEKIGGTAKLTEGELQRLGNQAETAIAKMKAMGIDIPQNLQAIANAAKEAEKGFTGVAKSKAETFFADVKGQIVATAAGFVTGQAAISAFTGGFRALVGFVSTSIKAFDEAEAAQKRLVTALRSQGQATPEVIRQYNDLATQFQRTTKFGDDLINEMEALLVQVGGVMPDAMEDALKAATNLSAGLGIELRDATILVAKAAEGNTGALTRYGIQIDKSDYAARGFASVLETVNRQFGGQAQAQMETYSGRLEKLKNDWNNVQEAVGKAILNDPLVIRALREIGKAAEDAGDDADSFANKAKTAGLAIAGAFGPGATVSLKYTVDLLREAADRINTLEDALRMAGNVPSPFKVLADARNFKIDSTLSDIDRYTQGMQDASLKADGLTRAQREVATAALRSGKSVSETVDIVKRYWPEANNAAKAVDKLSDSMKKSEDSSKRLREETLRLLDAQLKSVTVFEGFSNKAKTVNELLGSMGQHWEELGKGIEDSAIKTTYGVDGLDKTFQNLGKTIIELPPARYSEIAEYGPTLEQAGKSAKSFADFLKNDLGGVITSAFKGGGNIAGSIGSALGGFLTGPNGIIGKAIGKIGGSLGSVLGSVIPGLGTLLGGLGGEAIGKLVGKLFKSEEKQVNDLRDKFQSTFGAGETGFNKMASAAQRAGYDIKKLLDAKTVKDYQREIENLNDALRFQDDAMKTLDDTVAKYGFSLEELGPAFARQKLDEQAQGLWKDFQVLTGAGIDVNTVLGKMGGSINEFVQQALKTGTEIPIAMAPMLQKMVEMGQLTDENGNVITNLEDAGVTFAMTMTEGFQSLIGEVKKLTDAIARGLGLSLDNVTKKINDIPDVTVNVDANIDPRLNGLLDPNRDIVIDPPSGPTYASTGGRITDRGIQYFAGGGNVLPFRPRGTDTVPAMLTPGETVRTAQQEAAIQQALGSNTNTEILQVLSEIRALLEQGRNVSVQVDGRELVKAEMKALDRGGDLLTNYRDLLGVA